MCTHKNYQQKVKHCLTLTDSGVKMECFSHLVNSRQMALRKLTYSEAGQTLAPMNEWEATNVYL